MDTTAHELVAAVREVVIDENMRIYRQLFHTTTQEDATDPYWKNALDLYRQLDDGQREILFSIVRQVIVDTVSNLFAILDGKGSVRVPNDGIIEFCKT